MKELGPASNDQMVLTFLRAEIDSPKWGPRYEQKIRQLGLDRSRLIDTSTLTDDSVNRERDTVLGAVRGYGRNEGLFTKFPDNVLWRRVSLDPSEFSVLRYVNNGDWPELTHQSLLVKDGADNLSLNSGLAQRVTRIARDITNGAPIEDLILVDDLKGRFIIMEGNTRATAYAVISKPMFALVGTSPMIGGWASLWGQATG